MATVDIFKIDLKVGGVDFHLDYSPPQTPPAPQSRPLGWSPGPGDKPMRVYPDDKRADWGYAPRTLQMKLKITNAITRTLPPNRENTKVDWRSQVVMPMQKRRDWLDFIVAIHGAWAAERVFTPKYGYFDSKANPENPDPLTPANPYKLLVASGQNVNVKHIEGRYAFMQAQSYAAGPNYFIQYDTHPHLVLKQNNVGNRPDKSMFTQVDKGEEGGVGDVYLPFCSPHKYAWLPGQLANMPMAAIEYEYLEPFPSLPFFASMYGREVTITDYCFTGSNTWGYVVTGLDTGWYLLEEMLVIGSEDDRTVGGSGDDRRVYVTPWIYTCPIPVIGWTRQG